MENQGSSSAKIHRRDLLMAESEADSISLLAQAGSRKDLHHYHHFPLLTSGQQYRHDSFTPERHHDRTHSGTLLTSEHPEIEDESKGGAEPENRIFLHGYDPETSQVEVENSCSGIDAGNGVFLCSPGLDTSDIEVESSDGDDPEDYLSHCVHGLGASEIEVESSDGADPADHASLYGHGLGTDEIEQFFQDFRNSIS